MVIRKERFGKAISRARTRSSVTLGQSNAQQEIARMLWKVQNACDALRFARSRVLVLCDSNPEHRQWVWPMLLREATNSLHRSKSEYWRFRTIRRGPLQVPVMGAIQDAECGVGQHGQVS